jgi:hypothetical protein
MADDQASLFSAEQVQVTNDDWYTPKWIFDAMGLTFDIDVAAPPGGIDWIPATRHFSKGDDGLNSTWEGRVWMNPPFSKMTPWADKFREHRNGVALLPLTRNNWTQRIWQSDAQMVLLPPDLKFMRLGKPMGMQFPALLVAYEPDCIEAISKIGRMR